MVADGLPKVFKDKRMIQKVLFLFRASPFARRQAEKKQNQKAAVGGKKSPAVRRNNTATRGGPTQPQAPPLALPKGRESYFAVD